MQSSDPGQGFKVSYSKQFQSRGSAAGGYVSVDGACGVHSVTTKGNFVEILRFKLFHDYFAFQEDEHNFKKKVLKKYFNVSVVVNLECGDTRK